MPSNLLPMKDVPRDAKKTILLSVGGVMSLAVFQTTLSDGDDFWVTVDGGFVSNQCDGWLPMPGDRLPMSTAPRDGTRIQVLIKGLHKTRWEYVMMTMLPSGKEVWWAPWMDTTYAEDRDETNWLGWLSEPSTEW